MHNVDRTTGLVALRNASRSGDERSLPPRPGYQQLLADAANDKFDVVVAESLDRLSRDQADIATLLKLLAFRGIRIVTSAEGEISELHIGLKGTMNALYLKDLAQKTRRGLEGRVRQGKSGGGICYGYDLAPGDVGARRIDHAEAEIVRRIFAEYSSGKSPRAIATDLNRQAVPGPQGRRWRDTTIRGHVTRGTGILNNELYVGRLVWNRLNYAKDPVTGHRRSRLNPQAGRIIEEVPHLRLVDDRLWQAVKERQLGIRESTGIAKARETRFWENRRPQHLLTGLVICGSCGSRFASIGRDYLACSSARGCGDCANRGSLRRSVLEAILLDGLRDRLMAPELVEEFVRAVNEEINRERRRDHAKRSGQEHELAAVTRKIDGLVDAIADGLRGSDLQSKLDALAARRQELQRALEASAPSPVRLHPGIAQIYREKVAQLQTALQNPAIRGEAVQILRTLIERVVIHPGQNGPELEIVGAIAQLVQAGLNDDTPRLDARTACSVKVVAGARNHRVPLIRVEI